MAGMSGIVRAQSWTGEKKAEGNCYLFGMLWPDALKKSEIPAWKGR